MFAQIDFEEDGRAVLAFATDPERFRARKGRNYPGSTLGVCTS